ncbi:MAG TPA: endolytic transglycosylase MltG, partial [Streptosporangiaceae bacterium]
GYPAGSEYPDATGQPPARYPDASGARSDPAVRGPQSGRYPPSAARAAAPDDRHQGPHDRYADDRYAEPHDRYADDRYAEPGGDGIRQAPARPAADDDSFFAGLDDDGSRGGRGRGRARRSDRGGPGDPGGPLDRGGRGGDGPPPKRKRGRRAGLIAVLAVVLIVVVPLAIGGIYGYRVIAAHYFPANYSGEGTGQVVVQVKTGDTATIMAQRLVDLGVVASTRAFILAAEDSKSTAQLEPGFYRMHKQMNAALAYALLLNRKDTVQLTVTIPEGWRESQILTALGKSSGIQAGDYTQALRNTADLGLPSYARGHPEGYLFPATYQIQPNMTATSVLQAMVQRFNEEASSVNLTQAAAAVHRTPAEIITIASLAQAEGGKVSDFPKVARVIYNRLAIGMALGFDSTVMYALHTYGIQASYQQLQVNSPYNTYKFKGLPPGPIDSPGDAAIRAALHPATGNWVYFVTVNPKTKQTDFTASYAQFQQFQAELAHNLGQGG